MSEEEARKQFKEEFPNLEFDENMPLFCEDCFQSLNSIVDTKKITKEDMDNWELTDLNKIGYPCKEKPGKYICFDYD